jgi:hypothetical protein
MTKPMLIQQFCLRAGHVVIEVKTVAVILPVSHDDERLCLRAVIKRGPGFGPGPLKYNHQ